MLKVTELMAKVDSVSDYQFWFWTIMIDYFNYIFRFVLWKKILIQQLQCRQLNTRVVRKPLRRHYVINGNLRNLQRLSHLCSSSNGLLQVQIMCCCHFRVKWLEHFRSNWNSAKWCEFGWFEVCGANGFVPQLQTDSVASFTQIQLSCTRPYLASKFLDVKDDVYSLVIITKQLNWDDVFHSNAWVSSILIIFKKIAAVFLFSGSMVNCGIIITIIVYFRQAWTVWLPCDCLLFIHGNYRGFQFIPWCSQIGVLSSTAAESFVLPSM